MPVPSNCTAALSVRHLYRDGEEVHLYGSFCTSINLNVLELVLGRYYKVSNFQRLDSQHIILLLDDSIQLFIRGEGTFEVRRSSPTDLSATYQEVYRLFIRLKDCFFH
jgi:hypothetical protein